MNGKVSKTSDLESPMHTTLHLETARLILRSFEQRDIQPFSAYRSDPDVAKYQGWQAPFSLDQAANFVDEMMTRTPGDPGQWYQIAFELKATGAMIGDCAFQRLAEDHMQAEIGFTLARSFQGHGYGVEAVGRLIDYLFGDLDLHRVRANCDPANLASSRLLERLGMRHEGRFVESLWFKGAWADEDWYAMLRQEWIARQATTCG
jgi:RimJ/RimL family protein N-acetyltransferase